MYTRHQSPPTGGRIISKSKLPISARSSNLPRDGRSNMFAPD